MIICGLILAIIGALITFLSENISQKVLKNKREPNESDIVYTKLLGFGVMLFGVFLVFV